MNFDLSDFMDELLSKPENIKVKQRLDSYQFRISQQILESRVRQQLSRAQVSRAQAAQKTGLSIVQYLEFEHGINFDASQEDYLRVLKHLNKSVQTNYVFTWQGESAQPTTGNPLELSQLNKIRQRAYRVSYG